MYAEDDLLPLSALQHLLFCERQCALIHIEGLWADNRLTVEGNHLHKKVDQAPDETRGGIRIARSVPLRSMRLGLIGKTDVVEFHGREQSLPFPVEYKRGRPKRDRCDEVQLCAQALCLEEMLGTTVPSGALFYGETRHRFDVAFNESLRAETELAASRLHVMFESRITPRAIREPKCDSCSLLDLCLPGSLGPGRSVRSYVERSIANLDSAAPTAGASPRPASREVP